MKCGIELERGDEELGWAAASQKKGGKSHSTEQVILFSTGQNAATYNLLLTMNNYMKNALHHWANKVYSMENKAQLWNSNIIIKVHINIRRKGTTSIQQFSDHTLN